MCRPAGAQDSSRSAARAVQCQNRDLQVVELVTGWDIESAATVQLRGATVEQCHEKALKIWTGAMITAGVPLPVNITDRLGGWATGVGGGAYSY